MQCGCEAAPLELAKMRSMSDSFRPAALHAAAAWAKGYSLGSTVNLRPLVVTPLQAAAGSRWVRSQAHC